MVTDPRLNEESLYVGLSPSIRAMMIQKIKERPLHVADNGFYSSFPDHERAYAIQRKHGGVVFPPLTLRAGGAQ